MFISNCIYGISFSFFFFNANGFHLACESGNFDAVKILILFGKIDVTLKTILNIAI